jgi:hypothetical protein
MDTGTKLTAVLERETLFLDQIKLMSLQEGRKTTFCVAPFAWLLQHGYIARSNEFVFEGTTSILKDQKQGDTYTEWKGMEYHLTLMRLIIARWPVKFSRMTRRLGKQQGLSGKLVEVDPTKLTRIVKVIFDMAAEFF